MKPGPKPKLGICKNPECQKEFTKWRTTHVACSIVCAGKVAAILAARREQRKRNAELAELRRERNLFRQKNMPLSKVINATQREFNRFILERDFGQPCICCGNYAKSNPLSGGVYDAGHFRTRGAAPQLRFNEDNCHLQLKRCNMGQAMPGSNYRQRLIAKIGLERVEALENDNTVRKWTREELDEIRRTYLAKWKALRAAREGKAA